MKLLRLLRILSIGLRFGLEEFFLGHERVRPLRWLVRFALFWRPLTEPRAVRLRLALEALGPIFVKFGQMLSTRRDLVPVDIADELAKLQDRVPPFPVGAGTRHCWKRPTRSRWPRCSPNSMPPRSPPLRWPRCISPACTTARPSPSRSCAPASAGSSATMSNCCRLPPGCWKSCSPTASVCARAKWWPSSRSICRTNSTSCAKPPTARSCGAISTIRRCSWCPRCIGISASTT